MDKSLSEESKDLLRDMLRSEAWGIYESLQQEQIRNLRILATSQAILINKPYEAIWYSAEATGRENTITSIKDVLYGQ